MSVRLLKPYKITVDMLKRYDEYFQMPASQLLIVPQRELGDEVLCDVRWEDSNGELHLMSNKIFVRENLVPLSPLVDFDHYELWTHYYN